MADCPSCGYFTSDDRLLCVPCTRLVARADLDDPRVTMRNSVKARKVGADYTFEILFVFAALYFGATGYIYSLDPYGRLMVAAIFGLLFFISVISVMSAVIAVVNLLFFRFRETALQLKNMVMAALLVGGVFAIFPMVTGEKTSNVVRHIFGAEYGYKPEVMALDTIAIPN